MNTTTLILGALTALGTILGGGAFAVSLVNRPKMRADATAVLADVSSQLARSAAEQRAADLRDHELERQREDAILQRALARIEVLETRLEESNTARRADKAAWQVEVDDLRERVRELERQIAEKDVALREADIQIQTLRLAGGNGTRFGG